ncbi:protein kinase [Lentzea sp. NPDC034063]|uniref:protein kinase domain-containing protein n=1 Tax=unclassified Lentzea TaxID=2643253 RepID=UPI003404D1A0
MTRRLGSRYTLGEFLGSGAMGQVYEGVDESGAPYAFKLLRSDLVDDPNFIAKFHQERAILTSLRGQHLVTVHDLVVEGDTAAIVMDLVRDGSLRKLLNASGGTLLPAEVARIGAGIADALHSVHLAGFVHRDVKPENVLMDSSTPRLTDFGISKMTNTSKVGRSTMLAGTPYYVAPELVDGKDVSPAADLYSLGIVLYELCCGVTPFVGESVFQVLRDHCEKAPGRPNSVPDELWDVIANLLHKNPAARPRSAELVSAVLLNLSSRLLNSPVGTRLDLPPAAIPLNQGNDNETVLRVPKAPSPPPKKRRSRVLPVLAAIAVLLGGAGGAYALMSAKENSSGNGAVAATPTGGNGTATTTTTGPTTTTSSEVRITTMPDLVGKNISAAKDALPRSMKVEIVDQVDEKAAPDSVLSQEPAAGQPVGDGAKLVVARAGVVVYLDSLTPTAGRWGTSGNGFVVGMGAKQYVHSVGTNLNYYSSCASEVFSVEYNLSKGYRRFVAAAGFSDNSENTAVKVQLEVLADGRQIFTKPVGFGSTVPLDLDLTGVLRLTFQYQVTSGSRTCSDNTFALGEAKLLGLAREVPTSGLPAASTASTTTTTSR